MDLYLQHIRLGIGEKPAQVISDSQWFGNAPSKREFRTIAHRHLNTYYKDPLKLLPKEEYGLHRVAVAEAIRLFDKDDEHEFYRYTVDDLIEDSSM
jgi:hypothetical protein